MKKEEEMNFKKVMQQQINQKVKPVARQYGLKKAKGNSFILEQNNVLFILDFKFFHSFKLLSVLHIVPVFTAMYGMYSDVLPYKEERMRRCAKHPFNKEDSTFFLTVENKEATIKVFDERLEYLESTLHYCYEINTFEKYLEYMYQKMDDIARQTHRAVSEGPCDKYILGVYDGMQKRYKEAREKFEEVLREGLEGNYACDIEDARGKSIDEIKDREPDKLHYKFTQLFLDAVLSNSKDREENFKRTFEAVCNRIRKYYGMRK